MNSTMGTAVENHDNVFVLFYLIVQVHCETMNNSFLERDIYVLCSQSDSHSFLLASKSPKRSDWHQPVRAEINNWRPSQWMMHDAFIWFCYRVQREHWKHSFHATSQPPMVAGENLLKVNNSHQGQTGKTWGGGVSKRECRSLPTELSVLPAHDLISNWKNKSFYGIAESLDGWGRKGP